MLVLGTLLLLIVGGLVAALALTWALSRRIEAQNPPVGRFVDLGEGRRIHLLDLGPASPVADAPAVLLLHGANVHLADMRVALGDRLAERFRVVIPDRPGQGWSPEGGPAFSDPGHQASLIRAAVRTLGVGRVVVVGHSLGGLIAIRFALDAPEMVAGLVLINPTTHPRPGGVRWFQRFAEVVIGPLMTRTILLPVSLATLGPMMARLFRPEPPTPDYAAATGVALGLTPRRFLASLAEYSDLRDHLIALAPRYPEIEAETVLVVGDADPVVPPAIHADALAAVLKHRRIIRLPGAGHMAHHTHPDAIAAEIERLATAATAETSAAPH